MEPISCMCTKYSWLCGYCRTNEGWIGGSPIHAPTSCGTVDVMTVRKSVIITSTGNYIQTNVFDIITYKMGEIPIIIMHSTANGF